jgi:DNA-binding NtrC family response regulator
MATVLVADDEESVQDVVHLALSSKGHRCVAALSGEAAIELARRTLPDLVLVDIKLPGIGGLETFKALQSEQSSLVCIVLTGFGSVSGAVESLRAGVFDYLEKPVRPAALVSAVERALGRPSHHPSPHHSTSLGRGLPGFDDMVGDSPAMREIFGLIPRLAATKDTVLITGETGTGKELVARAIHRHSRRANGPFIDVNCAAIPTTLFESELFGHERGAFTDARETKPGKFELANGGTFFLDEVGELVLEAQAKLLRVLDRRQITRVGGTRTISIDVRLVAATNADLEELCALGRFRPDLLYRLAAVTVRLPPLRDRKDDVGLLIDYVLMTICAERRTECVLSADSRAALVSYDWPGNVRELEHRLREAVALKQGPEVEVTGRCRQPPAAGGPLPAGSASISLVAESARVAAEFEDREIRRPLMEHGGNHSAAARALGIDPRTLYSKMIRLAIRRRPEATASRQRKTGG